MSVKVDKGQQISHWGARPLSAEQVRMTDDNSLSRCHVLHQTALPCTAVSSAAQPDRLTSSLAPSRSLPSSERTRRPTPTCCCLCSPPRWPRSRAKPQTQKAQAQARPQARARPRVLLRKRPSAGALTPLKSGSDRRLSPPSLCALPPAALSCPHCRRSGGRASRRRCSRRGSAAARSSPAEALRR